MVEKVLLMDTGKLRASDSSELSGYTKVNSGNPLELLIDELVINTPKNTSDQPSLAKDADEDGYMEENEVQTNAIGNRRFVLNGYIDFSTSDGRTLFGNLLQMRRSMTVKALRDDFFTIYDDNPVPSTTNNLASQDSRFGANTFVYVKITNFTANRIYDSRRMQDGSTWEGYVVPFSMELIYTQD